MKAMSPQWPETGLSDGAGSVSRTIRDAVTQRLVGSARRQRSRTRWRRARGAEAGPSTDPFHGFDVCPNDEVTEVLMETAARALEDGRTETR